MARAISDDVNHISSISRIHVPWKKITCNVSSSNVTLIIERYSGFIQIAVPKGCCERILLQFNIARYTLLHGTETPFHWKVRRYFIWNSAPWHYIITQVPTSRSKISESLRNPVQQIGVYSKRKIFFRVWWMCSFWLSVIMCVISIQNIWTTWRSNPVTVTFDDKTTSISAIPFPSITICTTQKIEENLSKIEENDGYEELFPNELVNLRFKVNFNFDQYPVI